MPAQDPAAVEAVVARIRAVYGRWGRETPVAEMRRDWDALFADDRVDAAVEPVSAGGVPCAWIVALGADRERIVLYFHGGGFRLGSVASHRGLMARLSAASGCAVLGVDYRLSPEHPHPAPLEDALAVYDWALARIGEAGRIALAGDSAGGGLALALLVSLRDRGRALPCCALTMSAWTDLAATGESYVSRAERDPIHQRAMILAMARGHLGRAGDPLSPLASPLYADLGGLPPLLLQVGDRETVLDDSRWFAETAREAGVPVELEVWDGMIHVFQLFDELAEARSAVASAGAFLRRHLR